MSELELSWDIMGFDTPPIEQLEAFFCEVAEKEMKNLPFFREGVPVKAGSFSLFEKQWIGTVLTPWMLELVVLPGPSQEWPRRKVGERIALELPCGQVKFVVGELAGGIQYLACSLMSPLDRHLKGEQAVELAENSVKMALSLPVQTQSVTEVDLSRRSLFRGQLRS
ncbi:hydrogenase-2 assembly chaperone [Proteus hauseri]|uniref:hydrogenase-2 assembly chaperone n=1 Tax=Proteus hauseri TaxID=183417 RepID=UPI0032DA9007